MAIKAYKAYNKQIISGKIYNNEALDFLRSIKSSSIDLVFLDPPFNLGKQYDMKGTVNDKHPEDNYKEWITKILDECIRILKEGAALYLYHLPIWAMPLGNYLSGKLTFIHWIAVSMKNGFVRSNRLYPAHYALLFFTKGKPKVLSRPKIKPKTCKNCGEYVKDYGGYKNIINDKGINLSDFWDDLSPVRHKKDKLRVQNQLPLLLTDRIIEISGISGGTFVDPFAGTGTSIISAIKKEMTFKCNDLIKDNCEIIIERIHNNFLI